MMSDPRRALRQKLVDWQRAGVTHVPRVDRLESAPTSAGEPQPATLPSPRQQPPSSGPTSGGTSLFPLVDTLDPAHQEAAVTASNLSRTERQRQLAALADAVSRCVRCRELAETRTQTVFGVGNPEAQVMFIGEAPGADEDAQGEPFVGRAGQLLDKIIAACGWQREDVYICNILKCRPPGNRNPTTEEAANCRKYLDGQIRIVDPDYIVCWGAVAAQNLLDQTASIGRLRQKWFKSGRAKVLCTYHPSYLLRNPNAKKPVWEDMKFLLADMGLKPPVE